MADFSNLLGVAGLGGAIGKAIVQLELDTAKYQTEMRAAQAQTTTSANSMGNIVGTLGGVAKAGFAAAGIAAVAFGAVSVKAAIEANEAHLKLQNTFANQPRLSDSSVEAFERQADALRDLTGVDDEAIVSGQALLGQFKLTGDQVQEITPLVVDLSAKMGIDLEAAFKAVGKATQGSAGILSRYGIVLDEDKLKGDAFGETLRGLGVAAGFAEERADAEPWRKLGAQFEEIAEVVGQKLLPVIQDFTEWLSTNGIPVIEKTLDLLGKFGATISDIAQIAFPTPDTFGDVFDELGTKIDEVLPKFPELERALEQNRQKADIAASGLTNMGDKFIYVGNQVEATGKNVREFANMTGKELKEWLTDTRESFRNAVFELEDFTTESDVTARDFERAIRDMKRDARELANAMEELPKGKWVNDEFIQFISDQGPQWIVGFSNLNKDKQKAMQADWEESQRVFNRSLKGSFVDLNNQLDQLDKKTTKHRVEFHYSYHNFDPSMPGMQGSKQVR